MGCTTGRADLGQGERVTWIMRVRMFSCMVGDCSDEKRGRVCLVTDWKKSRGVETVGYCKKDAGLIGESDISILAHRIFRGERKMLYLSQYALPVVASLA